jgi:hypothetical protein
MMTHESDDRQLDELLRPNYEALRQPNPLQRQVVLEGLHQTPRSDVSEARRSPAVRLGWISAVAVISLMAAAWLLRMAPSDAYGIEAVPQRFHDVQTISLRGWQWVRDSSGSNKPPFRVPFEMLVKRPAMFRHTATGVSVEKGRTEIRHRLHLCDGKHESVVDENGKPLGFFRSLSLLDARLKTEEIAQTAVVLAVLGPPEAAYRQIGKDNADGRACDLYEGRFSTGSHTTVAQVWIERASGLPVRVVRDELAADGKLTGELELSEISVNVPLADDLFRGKGQHAEKPSSRDELQQGKEPPLLDATPTSSGSSDGSKLEAWQTLRISDSAVLVVWRRSAPTPRADGSDAWLSDITLSLPEPTGMRPVRHAWLSPPTSAERWSWSLVVPADGKPLGRGEINLTLKGRRGVTSLGLAALRFNDEELRQLLTAARHATLGDDAPEMSLADLRAQARKLMDSKGAKMPTF